MYNIVSAAVDVFDVFVLIMFFRCFFEWKTKKNIVNLACFVFMLLSVMLNNHFVRSMALTTVISIAIMFIGTLWFDGGITKKAFVVIGYMAIMITCDVITTFIMTSFLDADMNALFHLESEQRMMGMVISKLVTLFMVKSVNTFANRGNITIYGKLWCAMLTIPIVNIVLLVSIVHFFDNFESVNVVWLYIASISILYSTIMSFYLFDKIFIVLNNEYEMKLQIRLLEQGNENARKSIESAEAYVREMRAVRHDMKNQLAIIQNCITNKDTDAALSHIQTITNDYIPSLQNYINTENEAFNAIANSKAAICKQKHIRLVTRVQNGSLQSLDATDTVILFGNLFDNAIEASKNSRAKRIELDVQRQKGQISVFMRNTIDGSVLEGNSELKTTKSNKELHGLGTKNIKRIVDKHNGIINYFEEDGCFCCDILL